MKKKNGTPLSGLSPVKRFIVSVFVFCGIVFITLMVCFMIALNGVRKTERHMDQGTVFLSQGRFEESLDNFDKALKGNPRKKLAWTGKGICLLNLGRYEEALENYETTLEIYPKYAQAWLGKGMSYEYLGDYGEALKCFDKAQEIFPEHGLVKTLKKRVLQKINGSP